MTEKNWLDVAALDTVPEGDVIGVMVAGKDIALYEVDGEIFATDNICTHGRARMSDGFLDGREIECPLHQGKFDVCSGKALCAPLTEDIRTYPVKIENRRILLSLGAQETKSHCAI
jgi:naphthalene 1,2-dioxygenase system ferredoxin subunit